MKFAIAILATLGALVAPGAVAQLTPAQVVAAINSVASITQNSNNVLSTLSTTTPSAQVITSSQTLVSNFNTIIGNINTHITAIRSSPVIPATTAQSRRQSAGDDIVAAWDNFVAIQQAFLVTVNSKGSIFAQFEVASPIAAVLSNLEQAVDSLASALIAVDPTDADAISAGQTALDNSLVTPGQGWCPPYCPP
ncbi:hypothetical protein MVEN_01304400 [Mycena venus]|uniref:Uncharacterized protein n=1 Tax=Mycena venus TaxID=2733690 RepID=A0A8H6XZP8_9AGAR|nr:hypothetical protein MVEN_01304400 [Mycena venus]